MSFELVWSLDENYARFIRKDIALYYLWAHNSLRMSDKESSQETLIRISLQMFSVPKTI
jgi:hypothetical protein